MPTAKYFNKGLLKGTVAKSEIIEWKKGDNSGEFLAMEIHTGNSNRINATVFPTRSNTSKHRQVYDTYPQNSRVMVSGNVQQREFESNGRTGIDRSVSVISVKELGKDVEPKATFLLQGIVDRIIETSDGVKITLVVDDSYVKQDGTKVEREDAFDLVGDERVAELAEDLDVMKGCNAKFKGLILKKLEMDDYGDILGNIEQFKIEKVEEVIQPEDLEDEDESLDFI